MEKLQEKQRMIYPDLLRIVAIFFVIVIHTVAIDWKMLDANSFNWSVINIYNSIARFSVPVFIMISGSFMLDIERKYTLKKLYTHNILRIVTSFVFWSAAYSFLSNIAKYRTLNSAIISEMAVDFFKGHYHMWFLFTIAFLYMITPFLRKICENKKTEEYFLILCALPLIYNFISIFAVSPVVNEMIEKSNVFFILGYSGVYVLGHYLAKYDTPKKIRVLIYILGAASIAATAFIGKYKVLGGLDRNGDSPFLGYLLPTTVLTASAVYLLFKYGISGVKFGKKASSFISALSKLSFGIYLVHVFVIFIFDFLHLSITDFNMIISVPLFAVVTFIISAVISFVISKIPFINKYLI